MTGDRPKLLDLFCGAGGAARGYQLAGFHVTGVDINAQPRYAGDVFIQGDALDYCREHGREFDVIHASPPCQAYISGLGSLNAKLGRVPAHHPKLIEPTRRLLAELGRTYVIENVVGAPVLTTLLLCGSSFNLRVRRHRLFESSQLLFALTCNHAAQGKPVGVYGQKGSGELQEHPLGGWFYRAKSDQEAGEAMGIDWMTWKELTQAIPPAYTEFIGRQVMLALRSEAAA